jgi:hypothetical protein
VPRQLLLKITGYDFFPGFLPVRFAIYENPAMELQIEVSFIARKLDVLFEIKRPARQLFG